MKKAFLYIIIAAGIIPFAACKEDVPTLFNEHDGVYFSGADSLYYTFAKYPSRAADTVRLPVTVLGQPAATDRTIAVEKGSGAEVNATENVHYKFLPPYVLPAGQISTTIPVVIYRTRDLDSVKMNFRVQLKENEYFKSGISSKTAMRVSVAFLQKPP